MTTERNKLQMTSKNVGATLSIILSVNSTEEGNEGSKDTNLKSDREKTEHND